jgi:hypothetical protein
VNDVEVRHAPATVAEVVGHDAEPFSFDLGRVTAFVLEPARIVGCGL